jgi:hypothetical protein
MIFSLFLSFLLIKLKWIDGFPFFNLFSLIFVRIKALIFKKINFGYY